MRGPAAERIAEIAERAGVLRPEFGALAEVLRANNVLLDDQAGVLDGIAALLPELGAELTGVFTEAGEGARDFERVAEALGGTLVEAFRGAALEGKSFREILLEIIQDIPVLSQSSVGGGGSFLGGPEAAGGWTTEGATIESTLVKEHKVKNEREKSEPPVPELQAGFRRPSATQTDVGLRYDRFEAIPTNVGRSRSSFVSHTQRPVKREIEAIRNTAPSKPNKNSNKPWNSSPLQWTQREAIGLTASRQYLQGIVAIARLLSHFNSTARSIAHARTRNTLRSDRDGPVGVQTRYGGGTARDANFAKEMRGTFSEVGTALDLRLVVTE